MKVFVSHAVADERLARSFVELLQLGAGVQHDEIFFSSAKGSIPNGEPFPKEIFKHLNDADLIIAIVSRPYLVSQFCLAEAGTGLGRQACGQARLVTLLVPPVHFSELATGVFAGLQCGKFLDTANLSEVRDYLIKGRATFPGTPTWVACMDAFLKDVSAIVGPAETVGSSKNVKTPDSDGTLGSPLRFDVSATSVSVRSEGFTELVGDISLKCTCSPEWKGPPPDSFSVRVILGTNITSRTMAEADGSVTGDPVLIKLGEVSFEPGIRSRIEANVASFDHVGLEEIQPGETRHFQIGNLRANVAGLGGGERAQSALTLLANVSISGFSGRVQAIAKIEQGLVFDISGCGSTGKSYAAPHDMVLPPTRICGLRFKEGFPIAFKTRVPMRGRHYSGLKAGKVHLSESAIFGQVLQTPGGQIRSTALADHGTRLAAHFANVPKGVRLYVSAVQGSMGPLKAQLVESDSNVQKTAMAIAGVSVREVVLEKGDATVVWEVDPASYFWRHQGIASLEFPVFASWEAGSRDVEPWPGTAWVRGKFWPCPPSLFSAAEGSQACSNLPIPRFVDAATSKEFLTVTYQPR